ncbi:hypothetical protein [uncultured Sphingomonas sp.]|uniref:hypothetical protein n=1 Tax=uncultured Sphingomonas sp. TaxID=158754 RepID=UPI0025E7E09D|nr:hypothetical protein [uncultured Sphingomonas sp.]
MSVKKAFASRVMNLSIDDGSIFDRLEEDGEFYFSLGADGFELLQEGRDLAVASDRFVTFDHNSADAVDISRGIAELLDDVRGANDAELDPADRSRVIAQLEAANKIWNAGSFRILQLKVGVLLAISDAGYFLKSTSKAVAAALLTDAIKAFVKSKFSIDLDAL